MTLLLCLLAGIFPFGDTAPDVAWKNPPTPAVRERRPDDRWDKEVRNDALRSGVWHAGNAEIRFEPKGRHFIEVFLVAPEPVTNSFILQANTADVDRRHVLTGDAERMCAKDGARLISLLGWVDGPAQLRVATDSPRYQLLAMRWTSAAEFAPATVSRWLARARYLHSHPLFEGEENGPKARAQYLEQLWERLRFARDPGIRREAQIGLARAVYWQAAEDHEPRNLSRLARILRDCLPYRDEPLIRQVVTAACAGTNNGTSREPMLRGELCAAVKPVPWTVDVKPAPPGAPAWAVAQRQLRLRMEAITRWWVEVRQRPNGELGGAWDDDVEILRQWGPLALGLGSPVATRGIERLADGIWTSGVIRDGYFARIRDVEHSSEPTTDTQPLLAALRPGDESVVQRLRQTTDCAGNWIARQPDGMFRFRGSWFNCREFDPSPARAIDVHLNTRAMGPVLWYANLTRDPGTILLLTRWAESWVRAMRSTADGKPEGRFPPVVWSRDGNYLVNSKRWDLPDAEWDYFQWSGGSQEALASLMLAVHDLTGDRRWLDAAGESMASPDPRFRAAPAAFYQWRALSGDSRFDAFFHWQSELPSAAALAEMASQAREMERRLAVNFDMHTSEPLYTDRIYYALPAGYRQRLFGGEAPRGDRYPSFAVTWLPDPEPYARAVLFASKSSLRLRIYNFAAHETTARFHVWRLAPGRYTWSAGAARGVLNLSVLPQKVEIPLPGQREVEIEISPVGR